MILLKHSPSSAAVVTKLPRWRLAQLIALLREADRHRGALAYQLYEELMQQVAGADPEEPWAYTPHGKPYLAKQPHLHFNISHCEAVVACALSDRPVGIDVESVGDTLDEELMRHVCHESECEHILAAESPRHAFTALWTRKESYVKYLGTGLDDDLKSLLLGTLPCEIETRVEKNFCMSICTSRH